MTSIPPNAGLGSEDALQKKSCMFCGDEDWSTYVCSECETRLAVNDFSTSPYSEVRNKHITIVVPEVGEDQISEDLRLLTQKLHELGNDISGGLLGGEYGYGAYFENNVFMMHPYCWCKEDDCPWCASCSCPEEAFTYVVNGVECSFEDYLKADYHTNTKEVRIDESLRCDYCTGEAEPAPNFLHKPSNSKILWYKYIGRGMEIDLNAPWQEIIEECLDSLRVE